MPVPIQEYPKMLYPTGGGEPLIVEDAEAEAKLRKKGYAMHQEVLAKTDDKAKADT